MVIRRIAVRETGGSLHYEGPPKTLLLSVTPLSCWMVSLGPSYAETLNLSPGNISATVAWVKPRQGEPTSQGSSLRKPSYSLGSRLIFSVPFSYFLVIFFLPRCTLSDFPSVSSLASLPFLSCWIQQQSDRYTSDSSWFSSLGTIEYV